jgi:hypothetical protein
MADALIDKSDNKLRIMTFNDFRLRYSNGTLLEPFDIMGKLLLNFAPETRPVLWRIFILQMYIYKAIKNIHLDREKSKGINFDRENSLLNDILKNVKFLADERKELWPNEESSEKDIGAVKKYLKANWEELFDEKTY